MDFNDLLDELNISLGDSDNFAFTPEEKTRALTEAFNDPYATTTVWDSTLTYAVGTYQYAIPATLDTVKDIYVKRDNSQEQPEKLDSSLWEVVGTNIQFKPGADVIPTGYTLFIKGNYKYTVADTINDSAVQEYVLTVAQFRCYKLLGNKRALKFLKNDTSMAELVAFKRDLEQDMLNYRKRLPTEYQVG